MILLTNKEVSIYDPKSIYRVVEIYLTRWKCDECYRYIKQSYNLEVMRHAWRHRNFKLTARD